MVSVLFRPVKDAAAQSSKREAEILELAMLTGAAKHAGLVS